MKKPSLTHVLLTIIAIALTAIAIHPYLQPAPVQAQTPLIDPLYIEPGVQMLRKPDGSLQVYGKVVLDLRNGKIWGFPTGTLDPYPYNPMYDKPVTTHPFLLGGFALEDVDKPDKLYK
jgi:hypothetical protein